MALAIKDLFRLAVLAGASLASIDYRVTVCVSVCRGHFQCVEDSEMLVRFEFRYTD